MIDEAEQKGRLWCEMNVGAPEQPSRAVACLRWPCDKASAFQIIHAAIEGAHGLLRASGEQFAAREDGRVGSRCVDSASQCRE
ncbi:hypothetical protein CR51_40265 [Caballeronia megalochromosomata]|nr:hypothetical protein CR51_40265 [Caballeronia megalochromosomata]